MSVKCGATEICVHGLVNLNMWIIVLVIILIGRECSITMKTVTLHTAKGSHFSLVIDGRSTKRKLKLPAGRLALIKSSRKQLQQPSKLCTFSTNPTRALDNFLYCGGSHIFGSSDGYMQLYFDIMSDRMVKSHCPADRWTLLTENSSSKVISALAAVSWLPPPSSLFQVFFLPCTP